MFSSLFAGILEEMEKQKPRTEVVKIKEELQQNMSALLSRSTLCYPPFVACVQVQSGGSAPDNWDAATVGLLQGHVTKCL